MFHRTARGILVYVISGSVVELIFFLLFLGQSIGLEARTFPVQFFFSLYTKSEVRVVSSPALPLSYPWSCEITVLPLNSSQLKFFALTWGLNRAAG